MSGMELWGEGQESSGETGAFCQAAPINVAFIARPEEIARWSAEFEPESVRVVKVDQPGIDIVLVDERRSGFAEALAALREGRANNPPVILFILDKGIEPDCVRAFEHGAFDYVHLPISGAALAARLRRVWRRHADSSHLQQQLQESSSVAFQSMSLNAELGRILVYMEHCFACSDFAAIARHTLAVLNEFGLSVSLAIFHDRGLQYFSDDLEVHAIEKEVLETSRQLGRIYDFGARTTINFQHVGILVRNMPLHDGLRYGVLKDHLCFIANGLEARVAALLIEQQAQDRARRINTTVLVLQQIIGEMEIAKEQLTKASAEALESMLVTLTSEFSQLSLTAAEETRLVNLLGEAHQTVNTLFHEATERDKSFRILLSQLTETLRR